MNFLFIQLKRIGDLILTVPAIAAVRNNFPAAKISLLVAHGSRELLPAIPGVDQALIVRGNPCDLGPWLSLTTRQFDYCFDFSRTDRSAFLSLLSRARRRVTYETVRRERLRQHCYNEFVPSRVRDVHTIDHHLALLAPLQIENPSGEIRLALPETARAAAAEIITSKKLGSFFIVIHPGSARTEKFWVARRWAEVADSLQEKFGARVVMTGGASLEEQRHLQEIKRHAQHPLLDLSGQLDLLTLAALLQQARMLLTIDSAPMHLATALGVSQIVLFGPTNPFHWRPKSSRAVILHAGVGGVLEDFTPRLPPASMNEISTPRVIDAMQKLLAAPPALSA